MIGKIAAVSGLGLLGLVLAGCLGNNDPCNIDGVITMTYPPSQFTAAELAAFPIAEKTWNDFIGRRVISLSPKESDDGCDIRKDPTLGIGKPHLGRSSKSDGVIRIGVPYQCGVPDPEQLDKDGLCFLAILVHELGHMMGLQHVSDPTAVMFPHTTTATPNASDRAEAQRVGLL